MKILVDSNMILRIAHRLDPQHHMTLDAVARLLHEANDLCIVPQNLYEFWVVGTRPTAGNGLGLQVTQVQTEIANIKKSFLLLPETPAFFTEWEKLVSIYMIVGKNAHDTRLVAAMIVHGITHLLTFNKQDFQRFTSITVLTPVDVITASQNP